MLIYDVLIYISFYNNNLTEFELNIPASVKSIGDKAFFPSNGLHLKKIKIPILENVKICKDAFGNEQ
jgi:hypothetical protein